MIFSHIILHPALLIYDFHIFITSEVALWRKKGKANIFETFTCQIVNKAKSTADKQSTSRSWLLLTSLPCP